jgi:N-acetylmuramoyl-L-alanine amidase
MSKEEIAKKIEEIALKIRALQLQLEAMLGGKVTIPGNNKPEMVIVHHGGGDLDFNGVNEYHRQKWGFRSSLGYYIGYQKFIEFDGTLYVGRMDSEEGAHTKGYNRISVGICLQGNMENMKPTERQLKTLKEELDKYKKQGLKIRVHRQFAATLCPGKYLDKWVTENYANGV